MMNRRIVALLLAFSLSLSLMGCGKEANVDDGNIELLDPVGVEADYTSAEVRDLVVSKVYSGKVVPATTEVHFVSDQRFEKYNALPGDNVKKGDAVILASTEAIDKDIKNLKELIEDNEVDFLEFLEEQNEALNNIKGDEYRYSEICDNFESMTEAQKALYGGMGYEKEYTSYSYKLASTVAQKEHLEEVIKEKSELYLLDADYNQKRLARLEKKRNEILAITPASGTVIAIGYFDNGSYINKDQAVAAVGDFDDLTVVTEYIYKNDLKRAVDLYATINGTRYEITPVESDGKASENESSHTAFKVECNDGDIKAGDYAVVTVVSDRRNDALTVPNEAVIKSTDGAGVYVYKNDELVYTPVKTGLKNGFYTEILSGLMEGDLVSSEFSIKTKNKSDILKKGSVSTAFNEGGYIFYSVNEWVENPVEYGVTYIDEFLVKRYQRVEKDEVIARVHVEADSISIARKERTIFRAYEDLQKLIDDNDSEGKNNKAIKKKTEYINELEDDLSKIKADGIVKEIKAPYAGIITDVRNFEDGDILKYEAKLCMLAKEDNCFIVVEDEKGLLSCGNEALIEYKDAGGISKAVTGEVVTVSPSVLSSDLNTGYSLIKVSHEDLADMAMANQGADGWWMRSRFQVSVQTRVMDDVVVIPKQAVTIYDGITYVIVKKEDGTLTYKSFVAGGSDTINYWATEGISEGLTICWD